MMVRRWGSGAVVALAGMLAACATPEASEPVVLAGVPCGAPVERCPDAGCPAEVVTSGGPMVEPQTGRSYFLDYPCDLKPGEDVTLVLSLHGGGSYGNWQRHYFPMADYVDSHRLVVMTPNTRGWSAADDPYLQNIVTGVLNDLGRENVKSFWLAGHSMGSFNSRRIVCTDFFRDKADGYMSLSGGRVGNPDGTPAPSFSIPPTNGSTPGARPAGPPPGAGGPPGGGPGGGAIAAAQSANLDCDFSFIFAAGGHEPSALSLAETSSWAEKYGCRPRAIREEVVDVKGGYIYDSSRQEFGTDAWGRLPRGGTAAVMPYAGCRDGRVVADVVRKDKGHTEGLEPKVTRTLIEMMQSAKGGKLKASAD